jgi:hypothetical protein
MRGISIWCTASLGSICLSLVPTKTRMGATGDYYYYYGIPFTAFRVKHGTAGQMQAMGGVFHSL